MSRNWSNKVPPWVGLIQFSVSRIFQNRNVKLRLSSQFVKFVFPPKIFRCHVQCSRLFTTRIICNLRSKKTLALLTVRPKKIHGALGSSPFFSFPSSILTAYNGFINCTTLSISRYHPPAPVLHRCAVGGGGQGHFPTSSDQAEPSDPQTRRPIFFTRRVVVLHCSLYEFTPHATVPGTVCERLRAVLSVLPDRLSGATA